MENLFNILTTATPIAETLYGTGPLGPIISNQFQLGVANMVVGAEMTTIDQMHDDAQTNAERLTEMAENYYEMNLHFRERQACLTRLGPVPAQYCSGGD